MQFTVKRITSGPKHHLSGFHDLVQTNAKEDFALSLEVDDISRPPLPGETCGNGVIDLATGEFREISRIHTWNYPMGARQQWIGNSDLFTCNDRDDKGRLCSVICNARKGEVIDQLPFPIHCLDSKARWAVYFDYDRIYSVGGYGYVCRPTASRLEDLPKKTGLWVGDMKTGKCELLASLYDIASCGEKKPVNTGYPHYVTHAMMNPLGNRFLFLHRYRVADGGEITRLMTVGIDGRDMRCLAKGGESHFTWIDNDEIFIWGEDGRKSARFRELPVWRLPGVLKCFKTAKALFRVIRSFQMSQTKTNMPMLQNGAFLRIKDVFNAPLVKSGIGVLTENGHPMACPNKLTWLINDTYPDRNGERILMFYDVETEKRYDVERFKMLSDKPNVSMFDWRETMLGVDPRIRKDFPRDDYLFFRSGLHCDLHPRWSHDGNTVYFDSIHEGTRQVYSCRVINV